MDSVLKLFCTADIHVIISLKINFDRYCIYHLIKYTRSFAWLNLLLLPK